MKSREPKMGRKSLFTKIMLILFIGTICLSISISAVVINISQSLFIDTYGSSQEKVFLQIEKDLEDYYQNIVKLMTEIDNNWAFRVYLSDYTLGTVEEYETIKEVQGTLQSAIPVGMDEVQVLVAGMNGRYIVSESAGSGEILTLSVEEILGDELTKDALEDSGTLLFRYRGTGYTTATRDEAVIIAVKALNNVETREPYALVYVCLKEAEFKKYYEYFTSDASRIIIMDQSGNIVSSNERDLVGQQDEKLLSLTGQMIDGDVLRQNVKEGGEDLTILTKELTSYHMRLCGWIDNDETVTRFYDVRQIIAICAVISGLVLASIFILLKQSLRPLSDLSKKMAKVKAGELNQTVEVKGSEELQQLAITFNSMTRELNQYFEQLIGVQQEKRKAEIMALQMQINPHYVFNTLSSIKWLLLQGDEVRSARALDAFILLLRNTVYNTEEFITIKQEIENLEQYIYINHIRYGENVQVNIFVQPQCENYKIPKVILQPFIENAFFHAFPDNRRGDIQVFVSEDKENIRFDIIDNGIGMDQERIRDMLNEKDGQSDHFSGIGVNNVNDRIKLIYGQDYGVKIKSNSSSGTTVSILVPKGERSSRG